MYVGWKIATIFFDIYVLITILYLNTVFFVFQKSIASIFQGPVLL